MKRRFLSVLLSLCLVLGLLPTAAFAQGKRYVALGDSITAGYRLADDEKAFPVYFQKQQMKPVNPKTDRSDAT